MRAGWLQLWSKVVGRSWAGNLRQLPLAAVSPITDHARQAEYNAAIACMTVMLAHDVRKPFSILRMGLGMLKRVRDPADFSRILSRLVPEIEGALSMVDGLLSDVMELGSTSTQLIKEAVAPETLIGGAIRDHFRIHPKSEVQLSYDFNHSCKVDVHVQKVGRVFSNIVSNALQAMDHRGHLWFRTRVVGEMVEFCVGNSGPPIPSENIPRLFEAFFTVGKKSGTGLGLAIAHKIVLAHGGQIWCDSRSGTHDCAGRVEFFFTLPKSPDGLDGAISPLPTHSWEIVFDSDTEPQASGMPKVMIIEDNLFVLEAWKGQLHNVIVETICSYRALETVLADNPQALHALTLVITDVDLNDHRRDGFDCCRLIKNVRPDLPILLSSDGDYSRHDLVGLVDGVIGKEPVDWPTLLQRTGLKVT